MTRDSNGTRPGMDRRDRGVEGSAGAPGNAVPIRRDLSISPRRSVAESFLAMPVLLLPVLLGYLHLHAWRPGAWPVGPFLLLCGVVLLGVPAHEALHALGWMRWGGATRADLRVGSTALVAYVACARPVRARTYRRIIALPGLVLGVAPALAAIVTGNDALLYFGLAHLGAATGDAVILWRLRGVPGAALVRDHGTRVGCVLLGEPQEPA